jgi:hypothetical protein
MALQRLQLKEKRTGKQQGLALLSYSTNLRIEANMKTVTVTLNRFPSVQEIEAANFTSDLRVALDIIACVLTGPNLEAELGAGESGVEWVWIDGYCFPPTWFSINQYETANGSTLSAFTASSGRVFDKAKLNGVDISAHKGEVYRQTNVSVHGVTDIKQETEHFKGDKDSKPFSVKRFSLTTIDGESVVFTAYKVGK